MNDTPSRMFGLLCLLAGVWIAVYWIWEPSVPRTTIDAATAGGTTGDFPEPRSARPELSKPAKATIPPAVTKPAPVLPQPPKSGPSTRVVPPQHDEYTIQRGDTWSSIALRYFGDDRKAGVVARANPLISPDLLKPGTTIRVPRDPGNIQGRTVAEPAPVLPVPVPVVVPSQQPPPLPGGAAAKVYIIQQDDTLWGIAKRFYGKGGMWRTIYEVNKDRIPNPDQPPVGAEIIIPDAANLEP